jgi:aspartate kinase
MRLLMKFGGTSVADEKCIDRVVSILDHYHSTGCELAVVVSAQSGITDQLHAIAAEVADSKDYTPIDTLVQSQRFASRGLPRLPSTGAKRVL